MEISLVLQFCLQVLCVNIMQFFNKYTQNNTNSAKKLSWLAGLSISWDAYGKTTWLTSLVPRLWNETFSNLASNPTSTCLRTHGPFRPFIPEGTFLSVTLLFFFFISQAEFVVNLSTQKIDTLSESVTFTCCTSLRAWGPLSPWAPF